MRADAWRRHRESSSKVKATASVRIARPIDEVFAYVSDVSRMTEWVSGVRESKLISDKIAEGARFVLVYSGMARRPTELEVEVTEFDKPRVFASRTTRGPLEFEGRIELSEEDGHTIVTNTAQGTDDVATRVATWLLGWLINKPWSGRLRTELERMAAAIEKTAAR